MVPARKSFEIVCAANKGYCDFERLDLFANEEVSPVYVIGPCVVLRIVQRQRSRVRNVFA
eukprot:2676272-Pleurochrysis_carterae.AAC.2